MVKRVLMTGHRGYIGSVMAPFLMQAGYEVRGLDTDYYSENNLIPDLSVVPGLVKDIRDLCPADLEGFDAVIHLAALSNDPIGNLNGNWTAEINHQASVKLATLARNAGVRRFLFSSSCIMYGSSNLTVVDETCALDPKTQYAASKVASERAISGLAREGFSPTFLRNGTVYGVSPRMRFDTVFNNLMGSAVTTGKVVLFSNGTPWRPVVHIEDIARSFMAVLEAPIEVVHNQAFNNGADFLNRQIMDLAKIVVSVVPGSTLEVRATSDADQRTYRADFTKFARAFPDFKFKWTAEAGAIDLLERFKAVQLTQEHFMGKAFTRLKWLGHLMESGRLDSEFEMGSLWSDCMIDGVKIVPLRQIVDERGKIMQMLKSTDPHFIQFGEIYFSCCWPGTVKAWHIHKTMTVNNAVISGHAKLVLYDLREKSPTRGELQEIFFGEDNYCLVQIPAGIANGYKAFGDKLVVMANCATEPHDPAEMTRLDPSTKEIPYDWSLKHG